VVREIATRGSPTVASRATWITGIGPDCALAKITAMHHDPLNHFQPPRHERTRITKLTTYPPVARSAKARISMNRYGGVQHGQE